MIRFKIKLAIRSLLKNKVYSALIIGGFSIGFTACILIGLYYNAEHNVNKNFPNYTNTYRLYDIERNTFNLDYKLSQVFTEKYPEIEDACPVEYTSGYQFTIKDAGTKAYTQIDDLICTTNNFFHIFSVEVVESLSENPFNDLNSVVITESVAKRLYGDESPLGRTITQEFFSGTISAVIRDLSQNSSFKVELLLNNKNEKFQMSQACDHGICYYPTNHFLLLKNMTDADYFAAKLNNTIGEFNTNTDSLALQKLADIYLSDLPVSDLHSKGNSKMLTVFLFIAILIILLSSINYLNYTISVQYSRLKEIGIIKTNGAGWWQLISNSFIEVVLGVFVSLGISFILAAILLPYTTIFFGKQIHLTDVRMYEILPVFGGVVVAIILLNSLAPIYVLSRFEIADFLSKGSRRHGKQVGKQAMLTFQMTVSIALIAVVMLIFKQLQFVKNYDLGFNEEHLLRIDLPYLHPNPSLVKEETAKLPFVLGSTLSDGYPGWVKLRMGSGTGEKGDNFMVNCIHISDDYLETMGIHLLEGRNFLTGDKGKACLMNEEAVKRFGWDNLDNKKYLNGNDDGYQVVGKVKNFNVQSLHAGIEPLALLYDPNHRFNTLSLRLAPGNVGQQIKQIGETWKDLLPEEPLNFTFYDDQFQAMYNKEEKLARSVTFFSFIAIILTCMGILGQIFLISLNRIKEIGIRKVNGAKISEILTLLNKDFVRWVGIAFVIATPIAWYAMNKWLENFAYKTELSWWVFALAGVLALAVALLTVSWQSWKAATRNPVEALRYE